MYAIFKDGGHQYKAEVDTELYVNLRDVQPNEEIVFDQVLLVSGEDGVKVGQPTVPGAKVVAEVLCKFAGPKLVVRWFYRRKDSRKKIGHRQKYIKVKVKEIVAG
ncbi:MAG: 50S ribosomal protein L21 [Thermoguttaceae bacterium]|jgi:large subunit ribosomal protein L21